MTSGRLLARWLALDPAVRRPPAPSVPEVPRLRTWQEGRWHAYFHLGAPSSPAPRAVARRRGFFSPSTS